jgi:hypothetical protein
MTRRHALLVAGLGVGVAGVLGFFTYADDLRHGGELAAAAGLTLAGLGLFVAALRPAWPLAWLSGAIVAGLVVGAAMDAAVAGLLGGIVVGAVALSTRAAAVRGALPMHLWWLAALYCLASLLHFAHNAENLAAYPNLPAWLTRAGVYAAWLGVTAVGAGGVMLARFGKHRVAAIVLALYGALGLFGLAHYGRAPAAHHTGAMNATIGFEAATGAALAVVAAWFALVARRARA